MHWCGASGSLCLLSSALSVTAGRVTLLHEMSSPSSDWTARQPHARWVARMTKRRAPTGVGKSASVAEARNFGVFMSGYVWDLSGTDKQCALYGPGHLIHLIHFNHSMREPSVVIPVTAVVDDDGLVHIEGYDLSLGCGGIIARRCYVRRWIASAGWRIGNHAGTSWPSHGSVHGKCAQRVQHGETGRKERVLRNPHNQP